MGQYRRIRSGRGSSSGGFTLTELLTALAVLAIMMGIAGQALSQVIRAYERSQAIGGALELESSTDWAVHRIVESAYPYYDAQTKGISFDGGPHGLTFVGSLPGQYGLDGLYQVRVALARGRIILEACPLMMARPNESCGVSELRTALIDHVRELELSYVDDEGAVTNEWRAKDEFPALFVMSVLEEGGGRQVITAAPRIETDTGCNFDVVRRTCLRQF